MSSKGYENVLGGSLKLKGSGVIKKKKKKSKKVELTNDEKDFLKDPNAVRILPAKTEAELKFERIQKQRLQEKVEEMAKKSHKDKVQDFNKKLEDLSEHYDIPKVGPG